MTVLIRPVRRCVTLQFIAFSACQSLSAELVGFPSAARHLKHVQPHTGNESSVSRTKPGNNFIHFSGTQMVLLGYDKTASLGDGLCPSNSAGQTTHHLETWPYQAPVLGICLWQVQIISGVRGPGSYTNPRLRGRRKIVKEKNSWEAILQWVKQSFANSSKKSCQIWVIFELSRDLGQANALPLQEWQGGNHIKTLPDKNKLPWVCLGFLILHTPLLMTGQGSEYLNPLSKHTHLM